MEKSNETSESIVGQLLNGLLDKKGVLCIGQSCMETDPCEHHAYFKDENGKYYKTGNLSSDLILQIKENGYSVVYEIDLNVESNIGSISKHFGFKTSVNENIRGSLNELTFSTNELAKECIDKLKTFLLSATTVSQNKDWIVSIRNVWSELNRLGYLKGELKFDNYDERYDYKECVKKLYNLFKFIDVQYCDSEYELEYVSFNYKKFEEIVYPVAPYNVTEAISASVSRLELRSNAFINNMRMKADVLKGECEKCLTEWHELETLVEKVQGRWTNKEKIVETITTSVSKLKTKMKQLAEKNETKENCSTTLSPPLNNDTQSFKIKDTEKAKEIANLRGFIEKWINEGKTLLSRLDQLSS